MQRRQEIKASIRKKRKELAELEEELDKEGDAVKAADNRVQEMARREDRFITIMEGVEREMEANRSLSRFKALSDGVTIEAELGPSHDSTVVGDFGAFSPSFWDTFLSPEETVVGGPSSSSNSYAVPRCFLRFRILSI